MNIRFKDFILPFAFTLISVWIIQHVVMRYTTTQPVNNDKVVSGQAFVAPQTLHEIKPLNREIDFVDTQRSTEPVITKIDTKLSSYVFSTDGASLQEVMFKLERGNHTELVSTVVPIASQGREDQCFLVALNQKTPYFYRLAEHQESEESVVLHYQAHTDEVVIDKVFTIYKNNYKIDLQLTITPEKNEAIEARIFYPAPQAILEINDTPYYLRQLPIAAIPEQPLGVAGVMNDGNKVERIPIDTLDNQKGWYAPTLFGADNRYFIQVLVKDPQQFVKRAYYRLTGRNYLFSIVEGPIIKERSTWSMSFYFGPKQEQAMSAVDPRLEETLEYAGWLSIISKVLLKVLNFFYRYVGNYGLAIIIVTLIIKLILLPFTWNKPELNKKNGEYQKKLAYIQQKYKDDPQRLTMEKAELVKKHGMPGLAGCLPLVLQIPIFIGLSRVLSSSIELYRAPFGFWIKDLSARDPYYILPALITLCMVAQAMTAPPSQRLPILAMAVIFGAFAANFAAGLALYLLVNTFLSVAQVIIQRKFKLG